MKKVKVKVCKLRFSDKQANRLFNNGAVDGDPKWAKVGMDLVVTHKSDYWPIVMASPIGSFRSKGSELQGCFWINQLDCDGF